MFYCAAFIAAFATPIFLRVVYIKLFLTSVFLNIRSAMAFWISTGIILLIVHLNTYTPNPSKVHVRTEHPFLLADNRHFVFYIWRRTIRFHALSRYIAAPIYYACGWFVLTPLSRSQSTLFVLGLVVCTAATIVPSPLLEFRYFILPYFFWRLHLSPGLVSKWRGVLEFVFFEVVNAVTLWIFVKRPFEWASEPGKVQRFIW
jgi:alpha-1,2-glucosyltransferase